MLPAYINIKVGMLLKVERCFWSSGEQLESGRKTRRFYKKGDILEIRYPYNWHFRDEFNYYDHASEKTLRKNCSFFGLVKEGVSFSGELKLREILDRNEYIPESGFKLVPAND